MTHNNQRTTPSLRVALVLPGFSAHPNDWAIPALQNLVVTLAKHHKIHIFSQRYPAKGVYQFSGAVRQHAIGGGQRFGLTSLKIWLQTAQAIAQQHRKTPFNVIHAFWADEAGFSAGLAGAKTGCPVIVSIGGGELINLPRINYGARRFLARRLTTGVALKLARRVTAGSAYQLGACRAHQIPDQKLRLAPLGVDTQHFRPATTPAVEPIVSQAASLLPVKNQSLLLDIIALVKQDIPTVKLHLAGSGPEKERLAKLARRLNLSQTVEWCGQIPYSKMPQFFQQAQLYLQTSLHESQGMAVLEAMACGLPVLGTPVGTAEEVACLPTSWDKTVLAKQVVKILRDTQQRKNLSTQARHSIENRYSLPETTANFLDLYREVL